MAMLNICSITKQSSPAALHDLPSPTASCTGGKMDEGVEKDHGLGTA
jgi:hypothetical protein